MPQLMKPAQKQHVVETVAEWVAPMLLAAALAWAGFRLGAPLAGVLAAAVVAYAGGWGAIRRADSDMTAVLPSFAEPVIGPAELELEELLLEAKDEVLILDDPLLEPEPDSRVVRLFERQDPTPGELVDRIVSYLGGDRQPAPVPQRPAEDQHSVDASAQLQAALANIRASLR